MFTILHHFYSFRIKLLKDICIVQAETVDCHPFFPQGSFYIHKTLLTVSHNVSSWSTSRSLLCVYIRKDRNFVTLDKLPRVVIYYSLWLLLYVRFLWNITCYKNKSISKYLFSTFLEYDLSNFSIIECVGSKFMYKMKNYPLLYFLRWCHIAGRLFWQI